MPRPVIDDFFLDDQVDDHSDRELEDRRLKSSRSRRKRVGESSHQNDGPSTRDDDSDNLYQNTSLTGSDFQSELTDLLNKANVSPKLKKKKVKSKDGEDGCSSEEERWLHAIESGKLDEVDDELKKIKPKDPKLMTARQRAMLERKSDKDGIADQLMSLPTGYREKVITPEMLEEKAKKLQKRKQLADEKRENDKKKTMERLLKKTESKSLKIGQKLRGLKKSVPRVKYTNRKDAITVSMPVDVPFPLNSSDRKPKTLVFCGRDGCNNLKRYSCSKTRIPLCSLDCYKINLVRSTA